MMEVREGSLPQFPHTGSCSSPREMPAGIQRRYCRSYNKHGVVTRAGEGDPQPCLNFPMAGARGAPCPAEPPVASQKVAISAQKFPPREPRGATKGAPTPPRCHGDGHGPLRTPQIPSAPPDPSVRFPPSTLPSPLCTPQHCRSPVGVMSVSVLSPSVHGRGGWHRGEEVAPRVPIPVSAAGRPPVLFGAGQLTLAHLLAQLQAWTSVCVCAHTQLQACKQHPPALSHARTAACAHPCTTARVPVTQACAGLWVAPLARTRAWFWLSHTRVFARLRLHGRTFGAPRPCSPTCIRACTSARRGIAPCTLAPRRHIPRRPASQGFLGGMLPAAPGHVGPPQTGLGAPRKS